MNKPDSLRQFLTDAVPALKREPERLKLFIDKGRIVSTGSQGARLAWQYQFRLNLVLLDFADHPDAVVLPLLLWLSVHQRELLQAQAKGEGGIEFDADILGPGKVDLSIELELTERVIVEGTEGDYSIDHPAEPPLDPGFGPWPDAVPDPARLTIVHAGAARFVPDETGG